MSLIEIGDRIGGSVGLNMKLQIFRDGEHPDISGDRLAAAIAAYNPAIHRAPLTIGHTADPKAPAWGWVGSLDFEETTVGAGLEDVDPDLVTLWDSGRYRNISAAFYPPGHPSHPLKGQDGEAGYYLHHVAVLGAQPPQVKGLQNPDKFSAALAAFAEPEGLVVVSSPPVEQPEASPPPVQFEESAMSAAATATEDIATREAALAEREAALARRSQELQAAAAALRERELTAFAEGLSGIHPARRSDVVRLLEWVAKKAGEADLVQFSEGQPAPVLEQFKALLNSLPPLVEFAEFAGGTVPESLPPAELGRRAADLIAQRAAAGQVLSATEAVRLVKEGVK